MNRRVILLLLICMLFAISSCSKKNTEVQPNNDELQAEVQSRIDSLWTDYISSNALSYGGVALVAQNTTKTIFAQSNMPDNVSSNSYFRGASNTKTFTAFAIMLLKEQGKLNLDDHLTDMIPNTDIPYLPEDSNYNIPFKNQISIRQLLEHRAGIFDITNFAIPDTVNANYAGQNWIAYMSGINPYYTFTIDGIISIISQHQIYHHLPNQQYSYTNTGYMLLAKIIERVSNQSLNDYLSDAILLPNQLNQIQFPTSTGSMLPDPYISGKIWSGNMLYDYRKFNMSSAKGSGNLVCTINDLNRWVRLWQKGQAGLDLAVVEGMRHSSNPQQEYYGLGTEYIPGIGYGHTGAIAGYLSFMFYDPMSDFSIVLVANIWNMNTETSLNEQAQCMAEIIVQTKNICTSGEKAGYKQIEMLRKMIISESRKSQIMVNCGL